MARRIINPEDLPSNNKSHANRSRHKKDTSPMVENKVYINRRSNMANSIRNIANSLFNEIVLPRLYDGAGDFLHGGIDMIIQIFRGGGSDYYEGRPRIHRNYNEPYRINRRRRSYDRPPVKRIHYAEDPWEAYEDVYFRSRTDAELVLGRLMEFIVDYGSATVGDLYSLSGVEHRPAHQRYGWYDLSGVRVESTSHGFIISLPEAEYIN